MSCEFIIVKKVHIFIMGALLFFFFKEYNFSYTTVYMFIYFKQCNFLEFLFNATACRIIYYLFNTAAGLYI